MKFVILLLAVLLLLWMLFGRSRRGRSDSADRTTKGAPPTGREPEDMVACAHCGVNLPRSEAVQAGRLDYCSPAHRDAGPRASGS